MRSLSSLGLSSLLLATGFGASLLACGSDSGSTGTGAGTGTGGGSASTTTQTLSGTYDLSTSGDGSNDTGSLVMSSAGFTVAIEGYTLTYVATAGQMYATWTSDDEDSPSSPITITRTASSGDVNGGAIPLDFGGNWVFTAGKSIAMDLSPGSLSVIGSSDDYGFPQGIPTPENGATYTGTRGAAQDSIFGDFGGVWTLKGTSGGGTCTASFVGSTFNWSCTNVDELSSSNVQLTFSADLKTVTGLAGNGSELAAQLR